MLPITITLEPLFGHRPTRFGPRRVEHDVLIITGVVTFENGETEKLELGQVGKKPGSRITFRRDRTGESFPDEFKAAAEKAVAQYHGQGVRPPAEQPPFAVVSPDDDDEDGLPEPYDDPDDIRGDSDVPEDLDTDGDGDINGV